MIALQFTFQIILQLAEESVGCIISSFYTRLVTNFIVMVTSVSFCYLFAKLSSYARAQIEVTMDKEGRLLVKKRDYSNELTSQLMDDSYTSENSSTDDHERKE